MLFIRRLLTLQGGVATGLWSVFCCNPTALSKLADGPQGCGYKDALHRIQK